MLTLKRLKAVLRYDLVTGKFFWLVALSSRGMAGQEAGCITKKGYRQICIDKKVYRAQRLAWFYWHGEWPSMEIDHTKNDKDDNRISKLRAATRTQNNCNRRKLKNNKSGYKGVSWHKSSKKWRAVIQLHGHEVHVGSFKTPEMAYEAYCKSAVKLHGAFANTS